MDPVVCDRVHPSSSLTAPLRPSRQPPARYFSLCPSAASALQRVLVQVHRAPDILPSLHLFLIYTHDDGPKSTRANENPRRQQRSRTSHLTTHIPHSPTHLHPGSQNLDYYQTEDAEGAVIAPFVAAAVAVCVNQREWRSQDQRWDRHRR